MLTDLYPTLCQTIPEDGAALFGMPVGSEYPYWLAIDSQAFPTLLLPARFDDLRPDITLRAVDAMFSRTCVIDTDAPDPHQGCYSLIRLKESDPAIVRLFLRILEESFCTTRTLTTNAEIAARVQQVASLFSRIEVNDRDLIGLWGELKIIACAANIDSAVESWSTGKTAKYDFVGKHFVIDVKTTTKPNPKHRFSLEQLRPSGSLNAYIASLCVVEVPNGQTIADLMDSIVKEINDQRLRSTFLIQCLRKGGPDLYRTNMTLQNYSGSAPAKLYRTQDIPVPHVHSKDPIENVRFDVNLSEIESLSEEIGSKILSFESIA